MYQIACEDPIIHTSASPVCSDGSCPCHGQKLVTLPAARLEFIRLGTGKVHARDSHFSFSTMCGRDIPARIEVCIAQALPVAQVCGRCYASLRTYGGGQVSIEAE